MLQSGIYETKQIAAANAIDDTSAICCLVVHTVLPDTTPKITPETLIFTNDLELNGKRTKQLWDVHYG